MNRIKRIICWMLGHRYETMEKREGSHYTCSLRCSRCGGKLKA